MVVFSVIKYTLGFIFNEDLSKVVLIRKNKPDWQKGHLNGIGGKVEHNENSWECIIREIYEESNLKFDQKDLKFSGEINSFSSWSVDVFSIKTTDEYLNSTLKTKTNEIVGIYDIEHLDNLNLLPSVKYLIPMVLGLYEDNNFMGFNVKYNV